MFKRHYFVPLGALLGALLLFLAPRTSGNQDDSGDLSPEEAKIRLAMMYVQGSDAPMKGILMLRGLKDEYPRNEEIILNLGQFSMQTQQFSKAAGYFEEFIEMTPPEDTVKRYSVMIALSDAYAGMGEHGRAIDTLISAGDVLKELEDTVLINAVRERLTNYLK